MIFQCLIVSRYTQVFRRNTRIPFEEWKANQKHISLIELHLKFPPLHTRFPRKFKKNTYYVSTIGIASVIIPTTYSGTYVGTRMHTQPSIVLVWANLSMLNQQPLVSIVNRQLETVGMPSWPRCSRACNKPFAGGIAPC